MVIKSGVNKIIGKWTADRVQNEDPCSCVYIFLKQSQRGTERPEKNQNLVNCNNNIFSLDIQAL